jgi:hypothetical protein
MPGPGSNQPDTLSLVVNKAFRDRHWFCDACAVQNLSGYHSCRFSLYMQAFFKAPVKPIFQSFGRVPGGSQGERLCRGGIEAFHSYPNHFPGNIDSTPEKRQPRNTIVHDLAGAGKDLGRDRKKLGR